MELTNKEWMPFKLSSIFEIDNCKCSNISKLKEGNTPYVGATNRNNGTLKFVEHKEQLITKGNCIVFICDGEGSVGTSIYKKEDFIGSTTVKVGRNSILNKYIGTFITTIADFVRDKYNFGFKRNETHLKNEILMLPVNSLNQPDYAFMEDYMRKKEKQLLEKFETKLSDFDKVVPLSEKEWREFGLTDLFNFVKGDQNNMASIKVGTIPLVSAKKNDNGYKNFALQSKKLYQGNTLTLNNDGDGGAGIAYYQPTSYLLDSHVTALYPKTNVNKFALLYISRCITAQRDKFGHGYSINNQRLKVFKIMLPATAQGVPDYLYMENYIKSLEYEKLKRYLEYKNLRRTN
jgi:restriction endonuclease S subunit